MTVILIMTLIAIGGESSTHTQEFKGMESCSQAQTAWLHEVKKSKVLSVKSIALCAPSYQ